MNKRVTFNMKDIKRIYVVQQVEDKKMTGREASDQLGLSIRQVRRLMVKYREKGAAGLIHGNRGRPAHNRMEEGIRVKIQGLAEEEYKDYNDSHFTEELVDEYGLRVSRSTVRRIRREMGQKSPRKHRTPRHRSSRERKAKAGMMLQADGSRHDWLEGRGPRMTLIGYIDDATNEVLGAVFREEEDALGYFLGLKDICLRKGIPAAVYADRHTIFQSPTKATIEQELAGEQPKSQYGRLLDELGIQLIAAQSPQAKGRVDRLWGTLQDRLVKALRKAQAAHLDEANQVLRAFLPKFNPRFRVTPAQSETGFLPWPKDYRAKDFFCFKHTRTVTNDNTFPFDGHRFQIPPGPGRRSYAKAQVEVRQHLDGQLEVCYQGHTLVTFEPSQVQPLRVKKFSPAPGQEALEKHVAHIPPQKPKPHMPAKPAADHPWRKPLSAKPKKS
jgi:transposase